MILETKEDFENASLNGKEIKYNKTVFYTGEESNFSLLSLATVTFASTRDYYQVGDYEESKGVYAGICKNKQIWIRLTESHNPLGWKDAKEYCEKLEADYNGWHLPTKEELMLIYANKDIINQALTEHGGEPIKEDWYWSSSDSTTSYAWSQYFDNGIINTNNKNTCYFYTRPVLSI